MIFIQNYGWRMGNNLFQIACVAALAKKNNDEFVIPVWKYNKFLKNSIKEQNPPYKHSTIFDEGNTFHYRDIPYQKDMAINGYWQSNKYFSDQEDYIKELFEPNDEIVKNLNEKYSHIINDEKICSIHIRRTDYLKFPEHHPVVSLNYIMKAVKQFSKDFKFVVFSDDIAWCKENFMGDKFLYIEPQEDIYDFYLMSMCKNNIICNSSFSWWAAFLNKNVNKKIVAPKTWFGPAYSHYDTKDLIPDSWIKL